MNSFAQRVWFLILLPYHHDQRTSSSCGFDCFDCFVCLMPPFFNTRSHFIIGMTLVCNYSLFTHTHIHTFTYNNVNKQTNVRMTLDAWWQMTLFLLHSFFEMWEKIVRCVHIFRLQEIVRFKYVLLITCEQHRSCSAPQINICNRISSIENCYAMLNSWENKRFASHAFWLLFIFICMTQHILK